VVTRAFGARRKTLRNALSSLIDAPGLAALGIDPGLRPENVAPADYIRISMEIDRRSAQILDLQK
jgi:16S rRNA (adenine1518-N6/adenine1519-N6)-dimethyltransferase